MSEWPDSLAPPTAAFASAHLTDAELIGPRNTHAEKHLADCGECSFRARTLKSHDDPDWDDDAFDAAIRDRLQVRDLAPAWSQAVPTSNVLTMARHPTRDQEVAPGQLWTLRWHHNSTLCAVVRVSGWLALVAPVTTDVDLADQYTLLVSEESAVELPTAVWLRATREVPLYAFDTYLATLPRIDGHDAGDALNLLYSAWRSNAQPPPELPVGPELDSEDLDRTSMTLALAQHIQPFALAGSSVQALQEEYRDGDTPSVGELFDRSGLGLAELVNGSGLSAPEVLDAKRNDGTSAERADALAPVLAVSATELLPRLPEEAIVAASRPSWRQQRETWTRYHSPTDEPEDPTPLIRKAVDQPIAARTVVNSRSDDDLQRHWDAVIAHILHDE